jgi:hypothetical protein
MSAQSTAASIIAALFCCAASVPAQQLFAQALTQFPSGTRHVEYENLAALRAQSNFASLQSRFFAKPLEDLEQTFILAGIATDDIDEIVSGSRESDPNALNSYGIISGGFHLNLKALVKARIDQSTVYCLPTEKGGGLCFMRQDEVSALFGSFNRLYSLLHVAQGIEPALGGDQVLANLLTATTSNQSIRGFDDGAQLGESLRTMLPDTLANFANWPQLFSSVQTFTYAIDFGRTAHIHVEAACKSDAAATAIHQVLSTFGGMQSDTSPLSQIKNLKVAHFDSHVTLTFETPVAPE